MKVFTFPVYLSAETEELLVEVRGEPDGVIHHARPIAVHLRRDRVRPRASDRTQTAR